MVKRLRIGLSKRKNNHFFQRHSILITASILTIIQPLAASAPKVIVIDSDDIIFEADRFKYHCIKDLFKDHGLKIEQTEITTDLGQFKEAEILEEFKRKTKGKYTQNELRQLYLEKMNLRENISDFICKYNMKILQQIQDYNLPAVLIGSIPKQIIEKALQQANMSKFFTAVHSNVELDHHLTFTLIRLQYNCIFKTDLWCYSGRPQVLACLKNQNVRNKNNLSWLGYRLFLNLSEDDLLGIELIVAAEKPIEKEMKKWNLDYDYSKDVFADVRVDHISSMLYLLQVQMEEDDSFSDVILVHQSVVRKSAEELSTSWDQTEDNSPNELQFELSNEEGIIVEDDSHYANLELKLIPQPTDEETVSWDEEDAEEDEEVIN